MIKRTLEISREAAHLSVKHDQLVLKRDGAVVGAVPCEDLGMVVVDHPQATYSHAALASLVEADAVVVICGRDHLPQGLLIPMNDHSQVVWRIQDQIAASKPQQKRIWQQVIQAKIRAQAANLNSNSPPRRRLEAIAREVRSGDEGNRESQAARIYWSAWLVNVDELNLAPDAAGVLSSEGFRRDRDAGGLNALLNYGYAILRAAVARALVAAGLHPALGIHHSNRGNPFCLADDLMEPLRPLVDRRARDLGWSGEPLLDQASKAHLLELLTDEVSFAGETGPLMVSLHRYTASFVRCLRGEAKRLEVPVAVAPRPAAVASADAEYAV